MTNHKTIAVQVLRNIVSSVFKVRPQEVYLMTEVISPTFTKCNNECWSSQTTEQTHELWGFSPQKGFVNLTEEVISSGKNHSDGTWSDTSSSKYVGQLSNVEGVEEFVFFLHHSTGNAYDDNQSWDKWYLFKAPNFREFWEKIEADDVARWQKWIA